LAPYTNASQPAEATLITPVESAYLEVIAYLATRREPVLAAHLARWMRVRPPTVTHVLQRLELKRLISREVGHAIQLTAEGNGIAERIIRRHRLLEYFLYNTLQIPWHAVHREATLLEPALSPMMEAQIAALVGDATTCPHGNPIPGQGAPIINDRCLVTVAPGSSFEITRIDEQAGEDSCTLQFFWTRDLLPGRALTRLLDPVGSIAVQRGARRVVLSPRVARFLWGITPHTEQSPTARAVDRAEPAPWSEKP
jgi:DtxR family Mn-dependent transcriptional regulator